MNLINPTKILVPLGVAAFIAGLVIGYSPITLISSANVNCGSAFDPGTGTLNNDVQAACAPILSEKDSWATALIFVGVGLLASAMFSARQFPVRTPRLPGYPPPVPPPPAPESRAPQAWPSQPSHRGPFPNQSPGGR